MLSCEFDTSHATLKVGRWIGVKTALVQSFSYVEQGLVRVKEQQMTGTSKETFVRLLNNGLINARGYSRSGKPRGGSFQASAAASASTVR